MNLERLNGLSLFSSAGIGETYINECVSMKVSNELLKNRSEIYSYCYPETNMIQGDIKEKKIYENILTESIKQNVNFIYATPPCQSFSRAGRQKIDDPRDILFTYIIKLIKDIKPWYILIENVPEFIANKKIHWNNKKQDVLEIFNEYLGDEYNIKYDILNTSDFGTAQNRKRAIILISRKDKPSWSFPSKLEYKLTTRDVIGNLSSLESGEQSTIHKFHKAKQHNERHTLWLQHTPTGKSAFDNTIHFPQKDGRRIKAFKNTYKRINWDTPCSTITMANGSISSQNNVHPGRKMEDGTYSDARVLTIYELMLLTGLKDDWSLPEDTSDTVIRHILGECVPPLLIYHLIKNLFQ